MRELERKIGSSRLAELLAHTSGAFPDIKHLDARRAVELQRSFAEVPAKIHAHLAEKTIDHPTDPHPTTQGEERWNRKTPVQTMA